MELTTLMENFAVWLALVGALWVAGQGILQKWAKPILHVIRDSYLPKDEKRKAQYYALLVQVVLALVSAGIVVAAPDQYDFFTQVLGKEAGTLAGLIDYQTWMGAILTAVPLAVFFGEEIHNAAQQRRNPTTPETLGG